MRKMSGGKLYFILVILGFLFECLCALKENQGEDLPPDADLRIGVKYRPKECTRKAKKGDQLEIHYVGTLFKDTSNQFDSSRDRNEPIKITIGHGKVIPGWDKGMNGMCIGEKRKLVIPSDMAYGDLGIGSDIPGKATLVYEVELLSISDENPDDGDGGDDLDNYPDL